MSSRTRTVIDITLPVHLLEEAHRISATFQSQLQ
jgi:hypothetical protein